MITAGIDAGSRSLKVVLLEAKTGVVLASGTLDQGIEQERLAEELLTRLLRETNRSRAEVRRVVATGYGRHLIHFADTTITEITCHARGVRHLAPMARTVIEIGGQDSKLIRLDPGGTVRDFAMNDRCAAGTGRFLEMVAARLGLALSALGPLAEESRQPAAISSMCVVFAETEIIGLLAAGAKPADIVAGVQTAIAARVASMAGRSVEVPVVFTGGVALVSGMDRALAAVLLQPVQVSSTPMLTGALGAAFLAAER